METRKSKKYKEKTFEFKNSNVVNLTRSKPKNGNMEFDFDYYESDRVEKKVKIKTDKHGRVKYKTLDMQKLIINVCLTCVLGIAMVFVVIAIMSYLENKEYNDSIKDAYKQSYEIDVVNSRVAGGYKEVLGNIREGNTNDKIASSKVTNMEQSKEDNYDYLINNEYQLSNLYNNNIKDFKSKYNNKIILIEKALVNEVDYEGKYITLGTLDKLSDTNIVVEIGKSNLRDVAKNLSENSIAKLQGKLKVKDNGRLIIKCSNIKELDIQSNNNKNLNKLDIIGLNNLLDKIFVTKELNILNESRFTIKAKVASVIEFSTGNKGIILESDDYANVNVICILDNSYYSQWQILEDAVLNSDDTKLSEIVVNGVIGLSQYTENNTETFNVFINDSIIDVADK